MHLLNLKCLCNRSPQNEKNFKNYISISAIINYFNWLDASPCLSLSYVIGLKTVNHPANSVGLFAPLLVIAPKLKKSFALMHPDFESNLITNIFSKFWVSRTTGSDVIFAFVRGTQGVLCNFKHNACLSDLVFYSLYWVFIINANL